MADNYNLDELLADIEAENGGAPKKSWSFDEINDLLGIEGGTPSTDVVKKITVKETPVIEDDSSDDDIVEEPEDDDQLLEEDIEDSEVEEDIEEPEVEEEPEIVEKPKKRSFADFFRKKIQEIELVSEEELEAEDELKAEDEYYDDEYDDEAEVEYETENDEAEEEIEVEEEAPKKLSPKEEKTVVFDANTIKNMGKSTPKVADPVDDELDNIDFSEEKPIASAKSQEQTQVLMELADDEDMEETDVPSKEQEVAPETDAERRERLALAQKTIGIYPVRNEAIDHQIVTEQIEKSPEGAIENNKYRERFLNVPKQHLERTAEHEALHAGENQDPIERDGRIIKKSQFKKTADLEPVPTIVSADAELSAVDKTIVATAGETIAHAVNEAADNVDGQIKLMGFGEEEALEQIDEEFAEENLKEKRNVKVAEFKLDPVFSEADEPVDISSKEPKKKFITPSKLMSNFIDDEYNKPEDKSRIKRALRGGLKSTFICGIIQFVLTIVSLVITGLINTADGNLEVAGGSVGACGIINIVILLIAAGAGLPTLIRGFSSISIKTFNSAAGTLIVVLVALFEDLAILAFSDDAYTPIAIYTAAACATLTLSTVARYITLLRAKNNFDFITSGAQLYSTEKISGEDDAFEIGRGLLIGDPEICYNARMERPSYFIENSFEDDPADSYVDKLILITLAAAFIFAILFGIIKKSIIFAIGTIAAVTTIAIPAFILIASNITLLIRNRDFNKSGAAIVGHRAVEDSTDANAYVFDSTDIFKRGSSSIIGIKLFHNMRIDEAILYGAALVIESQGPLADIFDSVILGKKDLLPPVESLAYEERLGLSSWIHGRRVLFGTRDLLINHNVEDVPDKDFEAQYLRDDRKVIYLAVAGKIAAMFVVKYQPDKALGRYLRWLDRAGVSILVRSNDCNINEEMICKYFGLPLSAVKILSPVSGDIFEKYRKEDIETAPAGLISNGTLESSIQAFYEARELNDTVGLNKLVATIYTGMALLLVFVLSLVGGQDSLGITGGQIVLFQVLWGIIACALPVIKRRLDK